MHHPSPRPPRTQLEASSSLVIVGLGPRGSALVERVAAREGKGLTIHLVDDQLAGPGRTWRTDQNRDMFMNTLAGAVTLFTDASFSGSGPVREGPTLHEWCKLVSEFAGSEQAEVRPERRAYFAAGADFGDLGADEGFLSEVARTTPGSHPSRALYGFYCDWVLRTALLRLDPTVSTVHHHTRATSITPAPQNRTIVKLANGTTLLADAVALSPGWLPSAPSSKDAKLADRTAGRDVVWVAPDSPIHQDLTSIGAGEDVLVRGLGMGFFDTLSLLTIGRGGHFEDRGGQRLRYCAGGEEPVLHVGSRRGLPFLAKSVFHGLPPAPVLRRLREADSLGLSTPLRFRAEAWPSLARDANEAFYTTLSSRHPLDLSAILHEIDSEDFESLPNRIASLLPDSVAPFDLDGIFSYRVQPCSTDEYQRSIRRIVEADLVEADAGLDSPLKAALWEVNGARRWATEKASFDGIDARGYDGELAEFATFGGMIGSGPPAFRSRQLLALCDAGIVRFVGPDITVGLENGSFVAHSPVIENSRVQARVLVDAWVRLHDARTTTDPLLQQLMRDGLAEPFARRNLHGGRTPGAGVRIDVATSELIGPAGRHRIHLMGVPSDVVRGDTIIAPMPGTDATMLREIDGCVEAMLRPLGAAHSKL